MVMMPGDDVPTVAVLGAIGPDKGARRIERLAALARERGAEVRFVVIGYLDIEHGPWQSEDAVLTVHGRYDTSDLPALLAHYRVALVLYPSAGPETFSYTLSEAWSAGCPVLVPPMGALHERVRDSAAGWVMTSEEWRDEGRMLGRIMETLSPTASTALAAARTQARARLHATLSQMTDSTCALYETARTGAGNGARGKPFVPARVRHALGYRPWLPPPADAASMSAKPEGFVGRMARAAASRRHTFAGRMLFRLTPGPLLAALRARLK